MKKYRKSRNPFLYLGSYIGMLIGIIGAYFSFAIVLSLAETGNFTPFALLIPVLPIIFGFLFGWGIHLLLSN